MLKKLSVNNTAVTVKMDERTANIACAFRTCRPACGGGGPANGDLAVSGLQWVLHQ